MSRGLKVISTVIAQSNPLTYGTTEGRIRMLGKASRGTKGGENGKDIDGNSLSTGIPHILLDQS